MKKVKKILLFFLTSIILVACSRNTASLNDKDVKKIYDNINFKTLDRIEYNEKENLLVLEIKDEFIDQMSFDKIMTDVKLYDKKGLSIFEKTNFDNKDVSIKIISGKNNAILNTIDPYTYKLDIVDNNYSEKHILNKVKDISKSIQTFNELVGRIQVDLKKNQLGESRILNLDEQNDTLAKQIDEYNFIRDKATKFSNFDKINEEIVIVDKLRTQIYSDTKVAINSKNSSVIENNVLNINELDRISRDLIK